VLIVGVGNIAREYARMLRENVGWGMLVIGFVDDGSSAESIRVPKQELVGTLQDLPRLLRERVVDQVAYALPLGILPRVASSFAVCKTFGVSTQVVLDYFSRLGAQVNFDFCGKVPVVSVEYGRTPGSPLFMAIKRLADIIVAILALIVFGPLMLLVALLIKLSSRGPVFFIQARCGLNGRIFNVYKFRTMGVDAEKMKQKLAHLNEMSGPVFKIRNDPRVTRIGRLLRKFSIDELPQFINVLKGDMSLVGPRPPTPDEVVQYEDWQRRRLSVRPGLTCIWQVSGRNNIDFDEWMRLDLQYIDNWSLGLDLKLLAKTLPAVLSKNGAS